MSDCEGLAAFIEELRARHAADEFRGQERWDLGELTIKDVQYRVGYWLGRIDAFRAMSPEERHVWRDERRYIAWGLRALRRHLAEQADGRGRLAIADNSGSAQSSAGSDVRAIIVC